MNRRTLLILGLLGLGMVWLVSRAQTSPGYMDADYYYIGGLRLAQGHGFSEQVLWNYLDDPAGLPHPSHGYWAPLASLAAAAGMLLSGRPDFGGGRAFFLLAAAAIPPLTAALAYGLTRRKDQARLAGLMAVFPGFYLPYLSTTDSFGLTMLAGGLFFLVVARLEDGARDEPGAVRRAILPGMTLGALAGVIHLARADGAIWLAMALAILWLARPRRPLALAACLAGYLLVFGPWMARNLAAFGAPLAPGGSRALWVLDYDELYAYPASLLTPQRWLQAGLGAMLQARLAALGNNLQSALAVQGQVFLAPLALAGGWILRRRRAVQAGGALWLLTLLVMTLVFPFQGGRGGFFHSAAALQPLVWALAPVGLDAALTWAARRRGWNLPQARRFFSVGLVILALGMTLALSAQRIFGDQPGGALWNASAGRYQAVEAALRAMQAQDAAVVMVNNPPGYFAVAQRPAIAIPFGDLQALLAAARRYDARYLILEIDQVQGADLYARPGDRPGLRYLGTAAEARIYAIDNP